MFENPGGATALSCLPLPTPMMPAPTSDVHWNQGRDNPSTKNGFRPLSHHSNMSI